MLTLPTLTVQYLHMLSATYHNRADRITRTSVIEPYGRDPVAIAQDAINPFIAMVRPHGPVLASAASIAKAAMDVAVSPVGALVMLGHRVLKGKATADMIDEASRAIAAGRPTVVNTGADAVLIRPDKAVVTDGYKRSLLATVSVQNPNLRMPFQQAQAGAQARERYASVWSQTQAQQLVVRGLPGNGAQAPATMIRSAASGMPQPSAASAMHGPLGRYR